MLLTRHFIPNQSLLSLPSNPPLTPSVWINSLWFLSLVLSLTSALFGMIAKQWIREYMQWSTTAWLPQDFIALRQRRYEAFLKWKVPATIAAIPVLLEISLIFFFVGLAILLFTINGIVAGLSTAVIGASICLAFVTTVLPAIWSRCPYKSPAGWALLRLLWLSAPIWQPMRRWLRCALSQCKPLWAKCSPHGGRRRHPRDNEQGEDENEDEDEDEEFDPDEGRPRKYQSWRDRDRRQSADHPRSDVDVLDRETFDALRGPDSNTTISVCMWWNEQTLRDTAGGDKTLDELGHLRRAFRWISDTSQNQNLLANVLEGVATRVSTDNDDPIALLAFGFSVTCRTLSVEPDLMCFRLDHMCNVTSSLLHNWQDRIDNRLRTALDGVHAARPDVLPKLAKMFTHHLKRLLCDGQDADGASMRFIVRMIALTAAVTVVSGDWTYIDELAALFVGWMKYQIGEKGAAECTDMFPEYGSTKIVSSLGLTSFEITLFSLLKESVRHKPGHGKPNPHISSR